MLPELAVALAQAGLVSDQHVTHVTHHCIGEPAPFCSPGKIFVEQRGSRALPMPPVLACIVLQISLDMRQLKVFLRAKGATRPGWSLYAGVPRVSCLILVRRNEQYIEVAAT